MSPPSPLHFRSLYFRNRKYLDDLCRVLPVVRAFSNRGGSKDVMFAATVPPRTHCIQGTNVARLGDCALIEN